MENFFVNCNMKPMDMQQYEIVERKGIGHPDTIADGIAEAISIDYSLHCLKKFGAVLHHHLDKTLIKGGLAKIDFGVGKMEKPLYLIVNGRISSAFGDIEINCQKIQENTAKNYLKKVLPNLDVDKWLKISFLTTSHSRSPVWFHPRNLDDLPELKTPYASDSSAIVGFWPLSTTEKLVLKMERFFYTQENLPKFDYIGQDIKILAFRNRRNIELTLCIPFIATKTPTHSFYFKKLEEIKSGLLELANEFLRDGWHIQIYLNTQDQRLFEGPKRGTSHYFVVSGSALDYGEEGVVGRGNKTRGIIPCMRPYSTDAICGKNPSLHVGKVYAYFSEQIAKAISEELECECTAILVTQNKRLLTLPQKIIIQLSQKRSKKEISKIVDREMHKKDWIDKIVKEKYFLPLPGGTHGYQA